MADKMQARYDVIVIGGGPGGSSAASYLAKAGKKVLLLEKETFPRFHIGESLLPYNRTIFEELGVLPELEKMGFPRKKGAQFHLGNGRKNIKLVFGQGAFTQEPEAFQVERSIFDNILLRHAEKLGVEVRENTVVIKTYSGETNVDVEAKTGNESVKFEADFLVDASGRSNFTGNQENLKVAHPELKKMAIFGHFHGVTLDEGDKRGDTVIIRLENKWFWIIPISAVKTSVGLVMDKDEMALSKKTGAEIFEETWKSTPVMKKWMEEAELAGNIQTTTDFSYYNAALASPRTLRVGDAAGFMDPIFSAGVYLAMYSGKLAAETLNKTKSSDNSVNRHFKKYEKRIFDSMKFYWRMVEQFYTTPFMEVFLEPREKYRIASAVNAALAGELEGGWGMKWRMQLFFWIVKMQAKRPLLPRITFR
ncbi:MAG: Tryptophan halogenase [Verrucomicrobiales bacterium]|nr:Tryptophan halogenase [Verrucomicrobiales bacterium]